MRWPLRYQLLFPFAGVMLAVVAGISLLDAVMAARRSQQQIERQLAEVARTLQEATFPLTDAVLKQTRGLSGAEFVLIDAQRTLRAASLAGVDAQAIPVGTRQRPGFHLDQPLTLGDRAYLHTKAEIAPRGVATQPMTLHILYPQDHLRLARWEAAYPPLVVGALLLVVVAVLAFAIAGRLSRPILELRRQLSRLVQGDFQPLPVPQRNDELRDLIGSVNSLGDQLTELRLVIKRSERLALLGQLSGGLAHQLRNSIAGARLAVQIHRRHCRGVDEDSLEVVLRQLTMTEAHLQRFLTAGQPTAPRRAPCDLSAIIADVAALMAPTCVHRNVALELPSHDETTNELSADPEQLRQLLMNLVINAIEAAGPGGWVRIETARGDEALVLRVLDSGPGPTAQVAEKLFEPFITGKPEGIGLGLAVVRQIVEAHGGTIRYTEGKPTCFEVTLPAIRQQPDRSTTSSPAAAQPAAAAATAEA